ncbi:hypothetical protein SDRG_17120 [Saprolegnia diclina VS20]|uniref:Uncharacterized protein n=1 Tax=Saprolegnia diclina (strain VS20) TaxID=1156394 RepID=T0PVH0_SAPDV|nr:hypothetical protein SDRG_17120 [Saprolegnia diclina VS20]EQC25000.1 hypothetical protein SDRG_17120 [Saprolegnia diclina VS20]|eukprot:XP_008621577.1 hypothetical protein SDRG_17120 [Saprolegnia diclina VS20]
MLSRTPHLVELRLQGVLFGDSVLAEGPTASNDNLPLLTIRHVLFRSVRFTKAGFDAILSWLDRVTTLDHIDWRFSTFLSDNVDCAVRAIQCCVKAGARFISLNGCGFQLQSTVALAKGFRYIRSRHSIEFDLGSNRMYLGGTRALLKALGACTNVSMRLHSDTIPLIKDSDAQLTKARASGVTVEWTGKILWLRSPVGDLDATPAK